MSENIVKVTGRSFSIEQVENVYAALGALPVKTEAIIKAAKNMVLLRPHVDLAKVAREKLFRELVGEGNNQISANHPNYSEVVKGLDSIRTTVVEIDGLGMLTLADIRLVETVEGLQGFITTLVHHGILKLE